MNAPMAVGFAYVLIMVTGCGGSTHDAASETSDSGTSVAVSLDRSPDVKGPDTNNNGIRDDIDTLITRISSDAVVQSSIMRVAASIQSALIANDNSVAAAKAAGEIDKSIVCLAEKSPDHVNQIKLIFSATVNTESRFAANRNFEKALSAVSIDSLPSAGCES